MERKKSRRGHLSDAQTFCQIESIASKKKVDRRRDQQESDNLRNFYRRKVPARVINIDYLAERVQESNEKYTYWKNALKTNFHGVAVDKSWQRLAVSLLWFLSGREFILHSTDLLFRNNWVVKNALCAFTRVGGCRVLWRNPSRRLQRVSCRSRSSQRQVDVIKTVQCGGKAKAKRPIYVKHKRQHRMINRALRSR